MRPHCHWRNVVQFSMGGQAQTGDSVGLATLGSESQGIYGVTEYAQATALYGFSTAL